MMISIPEAQLCCAAGVLVLAAAMAHKTTASRSRWLGGSAMAIAAVFVLASGLGRQGAAFAAPGGTAASPEWLGWPVVGGFLLYGFACIAAIPRTSRIAAGVFDVLLVEASTLLILCSELSSLRMIGWGLGLLPAFVAVGASESLERQRRISHGFIVYQVGGAAAFVAGCLLLDYGGTSVASVALGLLVLAGMLRQGIPPFHTPMLEFFARAPTSYALPFTASPVGVVVIAGAAHRLAGPAEVDGIATAFMMASLVYLALLTLAQRQCRSQLCFLAAFSWTLAAVCLTAGDEVNRGAGTLAVVGGMGSIFGLGMAIWLLEERLGEAAIERLGGLAAELPALSSMFVLFGLSAVGLPLSSSFAGEDLWLHGLLAQRSAAGLLVIVGWCVLAIAVYRMYVTVFLGPSAGRPAARDLSRRERVAFALVLAATVGFGAFPRLALPTARGMARHAATHAPTAVEKVMVE